MPLTQEEVALIRELHAQGLSKRDIAAKLGKEYSSRRVPGSGWFYSSYLCGIIYNKMYHSNTYRPPRKSKRAKPEFHALRAPANECDFTCPVCGMAHPIVGNGPFESQAQADKCCTRLALCPGSDEEHVYRSDGSVMKKPRPRASAAIEHHRCNLF